MVTQRKISSSGKFLAAHMAEPKDHNPTLELAWQVGTTCYATDTHSMAVVDGFSESASKELIAWTYDKRRDILIKDESCSTSRLPAFERIMPDESQLHSVHVNAEELLAACDMLKPFCHDNAHRLRMTVRESSITLMSPEKLQVVSNLRQPSDIGTTFACNVNYLTTALEHIDRSSVELLLPKDINCPFVVKAGDRRVVIMPMWL